MATIDPKQISSLGFSAEDTQKIIAANPNIGAFGTDNRDSFKRTVANTANSLKLSLPSPLLGYSPSATNQASSANGSSPITDGGGQASGEVDRITLPRRESPEDRAARALEGYQSPMNEMDIARQEEEQRQRTVDQATSIYDPMIAEAKKLGEQRKGSLSGQFGIARGLGLSTAEISFMNNVQKQIDDQIKTITDAKAEFIATGNFQAQQRADEALAELRTSQNNLILKKAELALQYAAEDRANISMDLDVISALSQIPAGSTVTIGGKTYEGTGVAQVDPFFSGSNILDLMKSLPAGAERTIVDPNTGAEWNIQGIASADPDLLITRNTDNYGNENIIARDKVTGEILWSAQDKGVSSYKNTGGDGSKEKKFTNLYNDAKSQLDASRGDDGKYNTEQYLEWMRKYREADPTADRGLDAFLTDFPIQNLNLTNDQTAIDFVNSLEGLRKFDTTQGDDSSADDEAMARLYGFDSVEAYKEWKANQ